MTRFLLLLIIITLAAADAGAQVRRGTGLLAHHHGPVMRYARSTMLTIKPEYREQFMQATHSLQAQSARENGCLTCHYYEDPAARTNFLLVSEWATAPALDAYYRQPYVVDYFEKLTHWLAAPATVHTFEMIEHQAASVAAKP